MQSMNKWWLIFGALILVAVVIFATRLPSGADGEELDRIKYVTKNFREQKDPLWIGIGRQLTKRGIHTDGVIIVDSFTEDVAQYYVVILTSKKEIFEFYYDYLHKDISDGEIIEWHDLTDKPHEVYMHESMEIALKYFEQI